MTRRAFAVAMPQVALPQVGLLGSAVAVERAFTIPGLGGTALQAVLAQDIPVLQACVTILVLLGLVIACRGRTARRHVLPPSSDRCCATPWSPGAARSPGDRRAELPRARCRTGLAGVGGAAGSLAYIGRAPWTIAAPALRLALLGLIVRLVRGRESGRRDGAYSQLTAIASARHNSAIRSGARSPTQRTNLPLLSNVRLSSAATQSRSIPS